MPSSAIVVYWVVMSLLGQWSLLLLLGTILFTTSLPQRTNVYLLNFLFTTLLATFAPTLLFFAGYQDSMPPHWLCVMQSVMMDGSASIFSTALVILVFHTWAEVLALVRRKTYFSRALKTKHVQWLLLLTPYIVCAAWCTASLVETFQPAAHVDISFFVYCANEPTTYRMTVRKEVGLLIIAYGIMEFILQGFTTYLLYHGGSASSKFSDSYRANRQMLVRVFVFSMLQIMPMIVALINRYMPLAPEITEAIVAADAFVTFLVFGSQKVILSTWKSWIWRTDRQKPEITEERRDADSMA